VSFVFNCFFFKRKVLPLSQNQPHGFFLFYSFSHEFFFLFFFSFKSWFHSKGYLFLKSLLTQKKNLSRFHVEENVKKKKVSKNCDSYIAKKNNFNFFFHFLLLSVQCFLLLLCLFFSRVSDATVRDEKHTKTNKTKTYENKKTRNETNVENKQKIERHHVY